MFLDCFIYLICPVFSSVFFIKLAKEWPQFMKDWHSVEIAMGNFGISTNTKRKINLILGWFTLVGFILVDHIPLESYRLVDSIKCSKTLSDGIRHYYVNASFPFIFDGPLDYSLWKAAIFQVTNFQITFCWIYIDTFIILITQAFAVRMNQSRAKIEALIASKVKTILVWRNVREEHHRLCRLCFQLDQKISYLVLMSFFGNLYFLLAQLFNTLRPINDILQRMYFVMSLVFLILRLICVSLSAASINDENRNILRQLLSTPSVVYNFEIERLIYQITHKSVGISGKNFFQITRGLILKVCLVISFDFLLLQIFGFFPLGGLRSPDHRALKFSWYAFKTLYSLICLFLLCFVLVVVIWKAVTLDSSLEGISKCQLLSTTPDVLFNVSGLFSNLLFFKLATDWPQFMDKWHDLEITMGTVGISTGLKRKLKILTVTFLLIAAVEHILVQVYLIIQITWTCESVEEGLRNFFTKLFFHVFYWTGYALWKALFLQMIVVRTTFSWTYIDVFIILMSTAFVFRLKQFVTKLELLLRAQTKNPRFWKKMREEHYRLCKLCSLLDNKLSYIVLVSYGTNLYFILIQLFGSVRQLKSTLKKVYYFISFGFLITRLVSVSFYGSWINEESKKILPLLFSVPSSVYNAEVERFIDQVIKSNLIITGKNFFKITKGLILQIAGAIVTYELVLMQFNAQLLQSNDDFKDNI
ncbi:unnamed protein product, partial [Tenebrio molitor]